MLNYLRSGLCMCSIILGNLKKKKICTDFDKNNNYLDIPFRLDLGNSVIGPVLITVYFVLNR